MPDIKMTQDQINSLIAQHKKWLQKDPHALPLWGKNRDVSGITFSDADLAYARIQESNAENTTFAYTNLHEAQLRKTNFTNSYMSNANLSDAILTGATLVGANLHCANLEGADLCDANLTEADLYNVEMNDALLHGADLTSANLYSAKLRDADFLNVDLKFAKIDYNIFFAKNWWLARNLKLAIKPTILTRILMLPAEKIPMFLNSKIDGVPILRCLQKNFKDIRIQHFIKIFNKETPT